MGGLIGMLMAAQPGTPIARMVMNDVGPLIPAAALERIASYVGGDPRFSSTDELDAYLREIYAPFGVFTDGQWQGFVRSSARTFDDGTIGLAYDPGIAEPLRAMPKQNVDLWATWNEVRCPVLVIRGEQSDLLLADTAEQMTRSGPRARLAVLAGMGHAPNLMPEDQITLLRDWLVD